MLTRRVPLTDPTAAAVLAEYFAMRRAAWPVERGTWDVAPPVPSAFVPPRGAFLLAEVGGDPIGCGGVRMLDPERAEVKHLYLRAEQRGRGWGRALLAALEAEAVSLGAVTVVLDTNDTLPAAQSLYRSAGYREVERYNENPNATHWFAKTL
ncbi:GNAT family N-acetyltransferase [Actinotalea sp. M2MS4P-6]|uniref:GNAT family N-acetyltransferase n=1 Tax=Actinotalea sp. M2MS4P-6 TaxID=2983762 RepID=UPI0021E4D314|nr:GNAT family N-acetyltransferase [Actinotalea sp. M2MS4P-6]MCV2393318.1 GNAT family N-acetyltransferase [Actinotalea sp. M2MS4P-6]